MILHAGALPDNWAALLNVRAIELSHNHLNGGCPALNQPIQKPLQALILYLQPSSSAIQIRTCQTQQGETVLAFVLPKTCSNTAGDRHGRTCPLELINKSLKSLGRGTGTLPSRWATIKTVRYLTQNNDNGTLRLVDAEKHSLDKLDLAYNALTGCAPNHCCSASLHRRLLQACMASELTTYDVCCRSLPPSWAQMTNLTTLSLERNQLSGSLPDAWGANNSFPSLRSLSLVRYCPGQARPDPASALNCMRCTATCILTRAGQGRVCQIAPATRRTTTRSQAAFLHPGCPSRAGFGRLKPSACS